MKPESLETLINKIPELPDILPSVSFNTRLGKKYDQVDFDYIAFLKLARKMGLNDETISGMSIEITPSTKIGANTGGFIASKNYIEVSTTKDADNTLAHELKHAADCQDGNLKFGLRQKLGNVSGALVTPVAAIYLGSYALAEMGFQAAETIHHDFRPTAIAIGVIATACYRLDPQEIRARKAARENKNQEVIILKKHSDSESEN